MDFSSALLIGRRQTGKTTYIVNSALDDIYDGAPIALFDPYGTAAQLLLPRIPKNRWDDVVLIEPDHNFPAAYNPLYDIKESEFSLATDTLKHTLKSCWDYTNFPTPTMDDILYHGISAVLYAQNPSLVALNEFLTNPKRRKHVLSSVDNLAIEKFWTHDFAALNERDQRAETRSTLTKVRAFTSNPYTANILGQPISKIDMKDILRCKILIVDVSISKLGIEASKLLGSLLMAELHQAALSNAGWFRCYVDGAERFAQSIQVEMAEMTSGASYLFAITHLGQIEKRFQDALIGATDTLMTFTLGVRDAIELQPVFLRGANDTINPTILEMVPFEMCITPTSGRIERPYADPLTYPVVKNAEKQIRRLSREKYTRQRKDVEAELKRFAR